MYSIFFTIASVVVILNLFMLLVPEGKFEKYISAFTGLLVMLISASLFLGHEPSFEAIDFNTEISETENVSNISAVAVEQWIEGIATGKIEREISVKVILNRNEIEQIEITSSPVLSREELSWIATQCDMDMEIFVLK